MLPIPKKHISNHKKLNFLLHVLLHNLYAFVKLPWKTDIFRGLWKKNKNYLVESLIFNTKFIFLHTPHDK
jgi:hypothetical protein